MLWTRSLKFCSNKIILTLKIIVVSGPLLALARVPSQQLPKGNWLQSGQWPVKMKNFIKKNILVIALILIVVLLYIPSFSKMRDLKKRNVIYEKEIDRLEIINESLVKEKQRLIEDPNYLESVARDKMGVAKEGEVTYRMKQMEVE